MTFSYASLIFGLVAGILILIFINPLLSLLGSSENTWQYAKDYLFYIAIGAPFILFSNSFGHAVRGEGAARVSMIVFIHMGITNGIQPLLGYCYGANNKKRFISIMKFSGMLTLISGTVLSAIYIIFSRPVVTLFINDTQTISDYLAIVISLLLLRRSLRKFKGDPS